jgi:putative ABC transport system ATP-binding protein
VGALSDRRLSVLRNSYIGFVFQDFNLLPQATVYENVALPFLYRPVEESDVRARVVRAVEEVGLGHRLDHLPAELSGGERQRVAIARAIVGKPVLILADEPTGNLDSTTSREIMTLFTGLHGGGATILLVTHDREIASCADRVLLMEDGRLSRGL